MTRNLAECNCLLCPSLVISEEDKDKPLFNPIELMEGLHLQPMVQTIFEASLAANEREKDGEKLEKNKRFVCICV